MSDKNQSKVQYKITINKSLPKKKETLSVPNFRIVPIQHSHQHQHGQTRENVQEAGKNVHIKKPVTMTQHFELEKRAKTESVEYQKLHEKISSIEDRINEMKSILQKKREQKHKKKIEKLRLKEAKFKYSKDKEKEKEQRKSLKKQEIKREENNGQKKEEREESSPKRKKQRKSSFNVESLGGLVTSEPESPGYGFDKNPYSPRSNIYYVSQAIKGAKDHKSIIYTHLKTSKQLLSIFGNNLRFRPTEESLKTRKLNLPIKPGYENKKTIIFDLDETLVHCNQNLQQNKHQIIIPIKFPTGEVTHAGINIRPGAADLLKYLSKKCEIIVFTASHPSYANIVIDFLDPKKEHVQHRLYREHCYLIHNGPYVKDLRIINRSFERMVLVDNAAYSYAFQLDNGIPIIPYYRGQNDFQLSALKLYLDKILHQQTTDVRELNRKTFKLHQYQNFRKNTVQQMVTSLYSYQNQK